MNINLSIEEANILLKAIGTRIKCLENEQIFLKTKEYIQENKTEITRLNVLKVEIQRKKARAK